MPCYGNCRNPSITERPLGKGVHVAFVNRGRFIAEITRIIEREPPTSGITRNYYAKQWVGGLLPKRKPAAILVLAPRLPSEREAFQGSDPWPDCQLGDKRRWLIFQRAWIRGNDMHDRHPFQSRKRFAFGRARFEVVRASATSQDGRRDGAGRRPAVEALGKLQARWHGQAVWRAQHSRQRAHWMGKDKAEWMQPQSQLRHGVTGIVTAADIDSSTALRDGYWAAGLDMATERRPCTMWCETKTYSPATRDPEHPAADSAAVC
ncbi:hypothetical protein PSPO01_15660 [Paraphaeosphaeria sporulosa]